MYNRLHLAKGKLFKHFTLLCCALVVLFCCALPALASDGERRTVYVGFFEFDGYNMIDEETGKRSGYGYDLLTIANRYMDVKFDYVGYDKTWPDMLRMLEKGEVDILTNAQKSPEREEKFLFSSPTGTVHGLLNVLATNTKYIPGNRTTYNGMRIGAFQGDFTVQEFKQWAATQNFSYQLVYFPSEHELYHAFYQGEVDAILSNSFRRPINERTLEKFYSKYIYAIFRKEDVKLRDDFNYALMQMDANEGDWMHTLRYKYQQPNKQSKLVFNEQEKAIIQKYSRSDKPLVVTCYPYKPPFAYMDRGKLKGILPDMFALLMQKAGIPYTYKIPKNMADYEDICLNNEADIIIDWCLDNAVYADVFDFATTAPYLSSRLVLLKRNDLTHPIKTIASIKRYGMPNPEDALLTTHNVLRTKDMDEAVQAVIDGKADAAYMYFYTAMYYINDNKYSNLTYEMLSGDPHFNCGIAFNKNVSHELSGILTKCIYSLSTEEKGQIIAQNTNYDAQNDTLFKYFKNHPFALLLLICAIFACILVYFIMYLHLHERKTLLEAEQAYAAKQKHLAQKAEAANKSKTNFLFNMSHDIRTPMNAIIGFTTLAQNTDNLGKIKDYLQKVSVSSKHLLSLINDVLEMSRIESGKLQLNETPCSVREIFHNLELIMQEPVQSKKQSLELIYKNITNDTVYADTLRCGQVLVNLVSNAVKYTPEGGKIIVSVTQLPAEKAGCATYEVHVIDNGIGMSQEFVQKIFLPFEREHNSTVSHVQGTGLGMAITKSIIDLAHGTIAVHSTPGKGTDIVIRLTQPIYKGKLNTAAQNTTNIVQNDGFHGRHILVVEDNKLNREIAVTMLRQAGFTTDEVEDGTKAVEAVANSEPGYYDLILMDIQMPIMNGYEATKKIRALPNPALADIPIIALSANAFEEDKRASLAAGMNAHIAKPINIQELFKVVDELLQMPKA